MKFLRSVKDEMKKVTWPNGKQLRKDTVVVIETSLIFTVMFYIMDTGIQSLFTWILQQQLYFLNEDTSETFGRML